MFFIDMKLKSKVGVLFNDGKCISSDSSSSQKYFSIYNHCYIKKNQDFKMSNFQNFKNLNFEISKFQNSKSSKNGCTYSPTFSKFSSLIFPKIICFQDVSRFLLIFKAFWYNNMNKYGVPGPQKSRHHEHVKF